MRVRSATIDWPDTSLPSPSASLLVPSRNAAVSITSRIVTRLADLFGTSMPTADLPGIGASIRSGAAARASERSFCSAVIRLTFTSFFFNDTATTEIYTLSLHDALPIFPLPNATDEQWDLASPDLGFDRG